VISARALTVALVFSLGAFALPSRAAAPVAASPALLPASRLEFGLANGPSDLSWMTSSGVPWKYRYQYLAGGVNTPNPWQTWQDPALPPGQFAVDYMKNSTTAPANSIPVFTYYELLQSNPSTGSDESSRDFSNLNNDPTMSTYYADFKVLMQKAGAYGQKVVVHVEPDLWGYLQQRAGSGDASTLSASVGRTGFPDVAGIPNTAQGFGWALLHIRDLYATNAVLAIHASPWSNGGDIASSTSSTMNVVAIADATAAFLNSAGISSNPYGSTWDVVFNDLDDHDAAWWEANGGNHWWDPTNTTYPNFTRYLAWVSELKARTSRQQVAWQVPVGNQYFLTMNNTCGHYQDNVAQYFIAHPSDLFAAGLVAVMFGAGNACQTTYTDARGDGITNNGGTPTTDLKGSCNACNTHASTYADDDGGYLRAFVGQYYAAPATAPGAPTNVVAIAGEASATVSWLAPVSDGGSAITSYVITSTPASPSVTVGGGFTSATVTGLTDGTSYTFTATATNAIGTGPPSAASNAVVPGRGAYQSLPPKRILDTRDGTGGVLIALVGPGGSLNAQITGQGGVPSAGVSAVVLNVTVTDTTASSYLTVWPAGVPRPVASNLNWVAGQTVPNLVEVALGVNGQVSVYNAAGGTDVVFDVAGYVAAPTATPPAAGLYNPVVPIRVLDTRSGLGTPKTQLCAGQYISVRITGTPSIPSSGVAAVVLNVTATNTVVAPSYVTVYPTGSVRPVASNLNFLPGQTVPNRVVVKVGTGGSVDFYDAAGHTDIVADVAGWFTDGSVAAGGSMFVGVTPARILDTRTTNKIGPGATLIVPVAGQHGVPAMNATVPPTAVVLNMTATNPTAGSYLTVWPDGAAMPIASDLNYVAGQTVPNMVVVKLGAGGAIDLYNALGTTDLIVDVVGWYG
jgi:hypothetical protein